MARSHYSRPTAATHRPSYATAYFLIFVLFNISDIIIVIGNYFQNLPYLEKYDSGHALSAPKKGITVIGHVYIDHLAIA
jgi:hypothetical protein